MPENSIHNPELVLAMNVLKAEDTPSARSAFSRALANARLLAPVKLENVLSEHDRQPDGSVALEQKTQVGYILFTRSDGKKVFPAFTDWDELHKWSTEPQKTMILTMKDYTQLINQPAKEAAGLALNPMSQNLFVPAETMHPAVQVTAKSLFDPAKPMAIAVPKDLPSAFTDGLQQMLGSNAAVQQAWLRILSQGERRSWLLVVKLAEQADIKAVCAELAKAAAPVVGRNPVTVTPLQSGLGQKAAANSLPFYIRA